MEKLIERHLNNELATRDGVPYTITGVHINPVSDKVDTIIGTITVSDQTEGMQWNTAGQALSIVNIPTGNPEQPWQMMQARGFDLVVVKTLGEYAPQEQQQE